MMDVSVDNVSFRIDRHAVKLDRIVNMRSRAAAGTSHLGNHLAAFDFFAALDVYFGEMPIAGDQTVAVVDDEIITEQPFFGGKCHDAVSRGNDWRAFAVGDIVSPMKLAAAGEGRDTVAEA